MSTKDSHQEELEIVAKVINSIVDRVYNDMEADTLQAEINRLAEQLVGRFDMSWDDQRKVTRVELQVLPGEKMYRWHDDMRPDGFFDVALALHRKLIDLRVREEHGLTVTEASNGKG